MTSQNLNQNKNPYLDKLLDWYDKSKLEDQNEIKLQKEIFVDYATKKKALRDVTSVTSSNVRGVNNRIRYVIEKELQSFTGIFSIDRYRIKAKSIDYKTVKN